MSHSSRSPLLPLGAIAAGFGLFTAPIHAQTQAPAAPVSAASAPSEATLPAIKVKAAAESTDKEAYQATQTRIGKGKQELRDESDMGFPDAVGFMGRVEREWR